MKILGIIPARYACTRFLCKLKPSAVRALLQVTMLAWLGLDCGCKSPDQQVVPPDGPQIRMSDSPFQDYDREVVRAIQARWYELVDVSARRHKTYARGKVVIQFHLISDGRIKNIQVIQSNVDEICTLLCQKAILDPSPFLRWPDKMARMVNAPYREIRFTFWYE